jgi:hypothetical protein
VWPEVHATSDATNTNFDTDHARRLLLKESRYVATLELTTEDDIALLIDAVNLTWGGSGQGVRFSSA